VISIVVDMNLSPDWVERLSRAGFDAVHWSTVGDPRASDREIMRWAAEHQRAVMTHDLDFAAVLARDAGARAERRPVARHGRAA
jgi:predicted nuclease of predicted toxin-antitoxin system